YDETSTVTASASGSFHSLDPPTSRKTNPTAQPTMTLMRRLRNIRAASRTWGSGAATIQAIDQMGFGFAARPSRCSRVAEAMKTLTANRTPSRSRLAKLGHLIRVRASAREAGHAGALRGDRQETPLLVPELDVAEDIAGASVACVGVLENPRARRGREEL